MEIYKPYTPEDSPLWYQGIEEILLEMKRDVSKLIQNYDNKNKETQNEQN